MKIPDNALFLAAMDSALAEAELIAIRAKNNPIIYVRPDIGNWDNKYVASRYNNVYTESNRGRFDLWEQEAITQLKRDFPGVTVDMPLPTSLSAIYDGPAELSLAVFKQIEYLRQVFTASHVNAQYVAYEDAVKRRDQVAGKAAYLALFRTALLELLRLSNTMLARMQQGDKPKPVPGPGEHLDPANNPFDDDGVVIHKDHPALPLDSQMLSSVTVAQFKALMATILGK